MGREREVQTIDLANPTSLSDDDIVKHLSDLTPRRFRFWQRCGLVFRTPRHVVSWMGNYLRTEASELDEEFVTDSTYYTMHLLKYDDELQAVFRLRSAGRAGFTEYGIAAWRVGDDFACRE